MTFDKFTIKAQEAVQEAVNIAQRNGQQTIEPVHLLSGILEKATDVTNYIFQKLGMNGQQIAMLLQSGDAASASCAGWRSAIPQQRDQPDTDECRGYRQEDGRRVR